MQTKINSSLQLSNEVSQDIQSTWGATNFKNKLKKIPSHWDSLFHWFLNFSFFCFALLSFFVWFFIFITLFHQFCHFCSIFYKIRKPVLSKLHGIFALATLSFSLLHNKCSIYGSTVAKKKWLKERLWKLILIF